MKSSLATSGGTVELRLDWHAGHLRGAVSRAQRPPAARLLRGLPVAAAAERVPRLFSLCGKAQAAVAQAALAAAEGRPLAVDGDAARREATQEHLWRLLLDWPQLLGTPPAGPVFAAWYKRLQSPLTGPDGDELVDFVARLDFAPLLAGVEPFERVLPPPALLGPPGVCGLGDEFAQADETFAQAPTLAGEAAETGALARQAEAPEVRRLLAAGRPLAARIVARGLELAALAAALAEPAPPIAGQRVSPGAGLAAAWTARGLLVHRARVEAGQVVDYLVIAPTEWNFHPASMWLGALRGAAAPTREDALRLARAWVLALDPCVGTRIGFADEG